MPVYEIKYKNDDPNDLYSFTDTVDITNGIITGFFYKDLYDTSLDDIIIIKELSESEIDKLNAVCNSCNQQYLYKELKLNEYHNLCCDNCTQQEINYDLVCEKYSIGPNAYAFKNHDELKEIQSVYDTEFPDCFENEGIVTIESYHDDYSLYGDGTYYIVNYIYLNDIKKHFTLK